jgi:hypothetical protein
MNVRKMARFTIASAGLILLALAGTAQAHDEMTHDEPTPLSPEVSRLISDVRHVTADFRDFDGIEDAGYGKFLDCFVNNEVGGMGQHYVNGDLVGDDVLDPMQPEALVYEPTEDG